MTDGKDVFKLTREDRRAIKTAMNVAHRFLQYPDITHDQKVGLGNALYALRRLPMVTEGAYTDFGIIYRAGDSDTSKIRYNNINFRISYDEFQISKLREIHDSSNGSIGISESHWIVDAGGCRSAECDLYNLEEEIEEYLNLGAKITVNDDTDLGIDEELKRTATMPSVFKDKILDR